MVWMIPAAMLAASAIGAGASYFGQANANNANVGMANSANAANAAQNAAAMQANMDMFNASGRRADQQFAANFEQAKYFDAANKQYATELSNTAYQRSIADMRAAGLNPMLAYQQGGATSTPVNTSAPGGGGGPTGSVSPGNPMRAPTVQNALSGAVSSAFQGAQAVQAIDTAQAQIRQTEANTNLIRAQERRTDADTVVSTLSSLTEKERARLVRNQGTSEQERPGSIRADTDRATAQAGESRARTRQQEEETYDYQNWGPPSSARNPLVTGERAVRRGYSGAASIANDPPALPPSVQRTLDNLSTSPVSPETARRLGTSTDPYRALADRLLNLFR